jgi:imidazolonepropionase-like amidohydrolase
MSPVQGPPSAAIALAGATIYVSPTAPPIHNGIVLIENGTIVAVGSKATVAIPADAQRLDCSGMTLTAGFWNSHVHFFERKWADAAAIPAPELARQLAHSLTRYGFTSVFDLSSAWENTRELRARIDSGEVPGPTIRSTGEGLIPIGGLPPDLVLAMMGLMKTPLPEIGDAAQASAAAKQLLDRGADGIKLFASSQRGTALSEETMRAAIDEAHRADKPAFVHPNSSADVLAALRAGADVIAHTTPSSKSWDDAILALVHERKPALTPTLTLWKSTMRHDRVSAQDQFVDAAIGELRAWIAAGGRVLFGTDLGAVDPDPAEEYVLMQNAGMSFAQILASLTTTPAEQFGSAKRKGRVAVGFDADLVVLGGDPSKDVRALTSVQYTLRAGRIIYQP